MAKSTRSRRVSDLLHSFIAAELREMRDPRIRFVTITAVETTPDGKYARVYWTVPAAAGKTAEDGEKSKRVSADTDGDLVPLTGTLQIDFPDEEQRDEVSKALQGVESILKRRIGEELKLRYVPKLQFKYDSSLQTGQRIDELLGITKDS